MKKVVLFVIMLVLLSIYSICVSAATTEVLPFSFQVYGSATSAWSTSEAHTGSNSVKLTTTDSVGDYAALSINYSFAFSQLNNVSFWCKHISYENSPGPRVSFGIDNTSDGIIDHLVISADVGQDSDWTKETLPNDDDRWWYGTYNPGTGVYTQIDGPITLASVKSNFPSANIINMAIYMGQAGIGGVGNGSVYVDDIALNGVGQDGKIQDAVALSGTGDTISILAGTYTENVIVASRQNLTFQGVGNSSLIEPGTGIGFTLSDSDDITIKSLKIHTSGTSAHGIWVGGTPNGYSDSDNLLVQNVTINISGQSSGIYAEQVNTPHSGWVITGNSIDAPNAGVNIELYDVSSALIIGNTLGQSGSVSIVYASENANAGTSTIQNNVFNGNGNVLGVTPTIWIESDFQTGDGGSSVNGVKITGNTFNNWQNYAVRIGESSPNFDDVSNVNLSQNKFLSGNSNISLSVGTYVPMRVIAEYNYWGNASGPGGIGAGTGYNVTGNADYSPYYSDAGLTSLVYDDDSDGLNDASDNIVVNLANPNATIQNSGFATNVTLEIEGEENTAINETGLTGAKTVKIKDGINSIIEFTYDFSERRLNLADANITKAPGSIIVRGLNLTTGETKSVYVDVSSGPICVKDAAVLSLQQITQACDGPAETLFTTCSGTINGITCTVDGGRYKISNLTHSAVVNTSTTKLYVWDSVEGSYGLSTVPIYFYANYTNISSGAAITGADCQIWFNDTGTWNAMDYNGTNYNYTRIFGGGIAGAYLWNVSCNKSGFDTLNVQDDVAVVGGIVPEFGGFAIFVATLLIVCAFAYARKNMRC